MHGGGTCGVEDREMCMEEVHVVWRIGKCAWRGTCGGEDREMCMEEVHVVWRIGKCAWRRYMWWGG